MSTIVHLVIGLLLLLAGLISVIAAILGNPIRLGGTNIPGPSGGPARAVVAGIGTAALAACAVVFILNPTQASTAGTDANPPMRSKDPGQALAEIGGTSGSVGGLPPLTATPTPTGSPKPPVAASSAPPIPGKPTVTMIRVSAGSLSGCDQSFGASVNVANGPVTLQYVISVNGYVVGANPRTATVNGSSANLDGYQVDAQHPGEIAYNILTPNLLSDQQTWSVPTACQPALNIGNLHAIAAPGPNQNCSAVDLAFRADLNVTSPAGGMNVTYHLEINGNRHPDRTEYFPAGTTPVGESVSLPDNPGGYSVQVRYVVTSPVQGSVEQTLRGLCTSPAPTTSSPEPPVGGGDSSPAEPPVGGGYSSLSQPPVVSPVSEPSASTDPILDTPVLQVSDPPTYRASEGDQSTVIVTS